ncbi:MAG: type II toxin-antitoxin system RelE/ParE family toxin [Pyrinomonadaceae bacterium]
MTYTIEIKKSVFKALRRLDRSTLDKVKNAIDNLAHDPRPFGYKKLVDEDGLFRIRVGNYRIIYEIHDQVLLIVILRVAKRNEDTY